MYYCAVLTIMLKLIKYLSYINIQPYHDMIVEAKEFRMNLSPEIELEKALYVSTTAFNLHRVDVPYGGGKRLVSSVDRERGISILRSLQFTKQNLVGDGKVVDLSVYFDPLRSISNKYRQNNAIKFIQSMKKKSIEDHETQI